MIVQPKPHKLNSLVDQLRLIRYAEFAVALSPQDCKERLLNLRRRGDLTVEVVTIKGSHDEVQEFKIYFKSFRIPDKPMRIRIRALQDSSQTKSYLELKLTPVSAIVAILILVYLAFWFSFLHINMLYMVGMLPVLLVMFQARLNGRRLMSIIDDTFKEVRLPVS